MEIHAWLPVVGVLVVAAITPGPNNFMVMEASAGAASSQLLARDRARHWFERTMGALLALSALGIIVDAVA